MHEVGGLSVYSFCRIALAHARQVRVSDVRCEATSTEQTHVNQNNIHEGDLIAPAKAQGYFPWQCGRAYCTYKHNI